MAARSRISKRATVAFGAMALLALALVAGTMPARSFVQLLVQQVTGISPSSETWVPRVVLHGMPMINRLPLVRSPAESRKSASIEFLGAQNSIERARNAFWSSRHPIGILLRQRKCSLSAYADNPLNITAAAVAEDYIRMAGDVWPIGCARTRLGVPSRSRIVAQTDAGVYYIALATSHGLFASRNSITIGIANSSLSGLKSFSRYSTPELPATLTSADLDGDGNPDLVVVSKDADTGAATISVFPGNADGSFKSRTDYPTTLISDGVTVADFNNDGHPDLIVVGQPASKRETDPAVQVFLNRGDGTFATTNDGPAIAGGSRTFAAVADFNHDGYMDVATNDGYVLLGDGKGGFTSTAGQRFVGGDNLVAADFNRDGKIDVATVNSAINPSYENTIGVFLGNGDGTFKTGQRYASIHGGNNIGVSDLDGDGNADIVVSASVQRGFGSEGGARADAYFILGRGDGTFAGAASYSAAGDEFDTGPAFAVEDMNGDHKPDIVTTTIVPSQGYMLYTLVGNGDGTFTPGARAATSAIHAGDPRLVIAGDLNSDGKNDAIVEITWQSAEPGTSGMGDVAVFLGTGNGTFGGEVDTLFGSTAGAIVAGDFNNDKVLDVVAGGVVTMDKQSNPASGAVFFLAGKNNGSFDKAVQIGAPLNPVSFAVADLNGDKNLDLVIADQGAPDSASPGSVEINFGNGNGTFQPPQILQAPMFPEAVAISDVNNDGAQDIVVLSAPNYNPYRFVSTVYVFPGDGKGNFGAPIATTLDEFADGLRVADFNGDGFADLATASCCGFANSEVRAGNGDGTFAPPTELPIGISSSNPVVADLNGDKKPDLLVSTGSAVQSLVNISGGAAAVPHAGR